MKKFMVRFAGDNDFIQTVIPFVKAIARKISFNIEDKIQFENVKKENIVALFNAYAYALYAMYQDDSISVVDHEHYREYLQITEKEVYFDKEVDDFATSGQWNNDGYAAELNGNEIRFYCL